MSRYFTDAGFRFLRALARHNERAWFHAHKHEYEAHVRAPFQRLLTDLQPALAQVSAHYRADPKPLGGSLFRIQRDTRFANDKSPYKTWQGARLFHARGREVEAPSFYIHFEPGQCFVGAGLWHPQPDTLRRVRQCIVDNPASWRTATHAPAFRRRYTLDDSENLVRAPRGYPADFEFLDDLKRRNYVAWRELSDATVLGPRLRQTLEADLAALAPFMDYLCAALDLEF
ncbi:DUF2461 domain-containing protein [Vulcaniibacterium gelatinicum]|uniref:DUF2461 domain-containing protein n=1 Tax=Vulcaniibacterium gelatinicum TaxID=2598725 RepID=UPI0011CC3EA8|nr:DUF2461 domain-containing protein [Vulcaniibacterium gelatinicum]